MKFTYPALLSMLLCMHVHGQTINTLAGKGTAAYSGDGGAAKDCELNNPFGIAWNNGNLYIADRHNNRVRKVDAAGKITTIAGTGTAGYGGDNGPATAALLNSPGSVVVDKYGNIFISDQGNNRVRKVATDGTITTAVGDGIAGNNGNTQPATAMHLNNPRGLAIGPQTNALYIADQANNRVLRVYDMPNSTAETIVGTGTAGYNGDDLPAADAQLNGPYALAWGATDLYIADVDNERIRRMDIVNFIHTYAGTGTAGYSGDNGTATAAMLHEPIGVAVDRSGNVYIADGWNNRVRQVTMAGTITTVAGNGTAGYSGDGGPAIAAALNNPYSVTLDTNGNIYIADYTNNRIRYMGYPLGVQPIVGSAKDIVVSPEPNNGEFTVRITSSLTEPVSVTITNEMGQLLKVMQGKTNDTIKVQMELPNGIYILSAHTKDMVWHTKVIVRN